MGLLVAAGTAWEVPLLPAFARGWPGGLDDFTATLFDLMYPMYPLDPFVLRACIAADVRLLSRPGLNTLVIAVSYPGGSSTDNGFSTFILDMSTKSYTHVAAFRYLSWFRAWAACLGCLC